MVDDKILDWYPQCSICNAILPDNVEEHRCANTLHNRFFQAAWTYVNKDAEWLDIMWEGRIVQINADLEIREKEINK